MSAAGELYDAVRYPGSAFPQTHPERLAAIATLLGLRPVPVATCRVLEIGCGEGGNLVPMAVGLPDATFVGIDVSADAIARARDLAAAVGATNVTFRHEGVEDHAPDGPYDHVVAHGVLSWVPPDVRDRLLALVGAALAPHGTAYVSYNALPGAHAPRAVRDVLRAHLAQVVAPADRLARARATLALLAAGDDLRGPLAAEAARLVEAPDALLFHDVLAPENHPLSIGDLADLAAPHGLAFLAEASPATRDEHLVPPALRTALLDPLDDVLDREAMLDRLRDRRFRQTVVCRADAPVDRALSADRLTGLAASSAARPEPPDRPDAPTTFAVPGGPRITARHPVVAAVLTALGDRWPAVVPATEILGAYPDPGERAIAADALLRGFVGGTVGLHAHVPRVASSPTARPRATRLARLQAAQGGPVTTLRHTTVTLGDPDRRALLALLDGTRDTAALAAVTGWPTDAVRRDLRVLARSGLLLDEGD